MLPLAAIRSSICARFPPMEKAFRFCFTSAACWRGRWGSNPRWAAISRTIASTSGQHFAEIPLDKLDADDHAELVKLVGEPAAEAMLAAGKWRGWRLSIGADGVWHTYMEIGP